MTKLFRCLLFDKNKRPKLLNPFINTIASDNNTIRRICEITRENRDNQMPEKSGILYTILCPQRNECPSLDHTPRRSSMGEE